MSVLARAAVALAGRAAAADVDTLWQRLLPRASPTEIFERSSTVTLPEPARRWLSHAIEPGTPLHSAVAVQMHGHLRLGRWLPFRAVQLQAPPYGYLWVARVGREPFTIRGYDSYADGIGQMHWRLPGGVPVVTAVGPDVDRSAAGRVVLDAVMVPTAWLGTSVTWTAGRTADSARAEWVVDGTRRAVEVVVGADDEVASVVMPRWGNPLSRPWGEYPCGGLLSAAHSFGGVEIATQIRAGYFFGLDEWARGEFFRATITRAEFL